MTRRNEAKDEDLLAEKWLVAFRNPSSKKSPNGSTFVRQFYATGYYEAYDTVLTHAERMNLEVLWFREKRNCGQYMNHNYPGLESKCIYCNKKFSHEAIPCAHDGCEAEFCSRQCMNEHTLLKHRIRA